MLALSRVSGLGRSIHSLKYRRHTLSGCRHLGLLAMMPPLQ